MIFEFTLLFFVRLLSGLFALGLVISLWKKKKTEGVIFLILFEFSASIWALTDGFEHAATSLPLKILCSQIGYIGSSTTTIFFLLFTLAYTQAEKYIKPQVIGLLLLIPALTVLLVFTNSYHHLIWEKVNYYSLTNESEYIYGKWFWPFMFYEYMVLLTAIIILLTGTFRFYKIYKIQLST